MVFRQGSVPSSQTALNLSLPAQGLYAKLGVPNSLCPVVK